MIDVLYVAKNRLTYTRETIFALDAHTAWEHVRRLVIVDDDSTDGTHDFLTEYAAGDLGGITAALDAGVDVHYVHELVGGPVDAMNLYLDRFSTGADLFAKVDNDFVVCPGWLEELVRVFDLHESELDILGTEPFVGGPTPIPDPARTITPAEHIGGKGLMRVSAWEGREMWAEGRQGFTQWQVRHEDVRCAWITPDLATFGLDQLPREPWIELSNRYTELEQHRTLGFYHPNERYSEWWSPRFETVIP